MMSRSISCYHVVAVMRPVQSMSCSKMRFMLLQSRKSLDMVFRRSSADARVQPPMGGPPPRRIGAYGFALLSVPILTFCLGTWQVKRRAWKLRLIEELGRKTHLQPIELPLEYILALNVNSDPMMMRDMEYRPVRVQGHFLHDQEMYIQPKSLIKKGAVSSGGGIVSSPQTIGGALVITPFRLSDGQGTILVNRGWVPRKLISPGSRQKGQVEGEVEITGIFRITDPRPPFAPHDNPDSKFFHRRDVEQMAALRGTLPIWVDADDRSTVEGGPIGGQTLVSIRNEHFSYIITWYVRNGEKLPISPIYTYPRIEMASPVPTMDSVDDEVLLTTHASPEPTKASFSMGAAEDWQLPLKYRRRPLDDYEIEYINKGGPPEL
ncbi:unnamed protein product [Darwinula stevensoni]|uniref:SURF1-like protein n=1 Tax=Darwinula stevensoni TaxID=69355 RepID=A0A7R8X4Y6_9CRUS|nr:unnamed protein product [Darwinula stevensoni]CAG0884084.1 unnamed protein product [Darwinula stevensoni]